MIAPKGLRSQIASEIIINYWRLSDNIGALQKRLKDDIGSGKADQTEESFIDFDDEH